jgi:diacylglycerol kinase (ATP)
VAKPVVVIANPAAGRGRSARLISEVRARFAASGVTDVHLTRCAGDETILARQAAAEGVDTIVAVGGDGTWGKVARGILESGAAPRLALIAAGTGNDFAYNCGIPAADLDAMVPIALGSAGREVDVGRVDDIVFLNVTGFGFQADVVREASRVRWLRGHAVYMLTAARRLCSYPGLMASVAGDGPSRRLLVVISNGARFGGGFTIAPDARTDDGALDLVVVRDAPPLRRAALFAAVKRTAHIGAPEISMRRVQELLLEFDSPPVFDIDGDLHQARGREVVVACLPRALRLAV